MKRLVNLRNKDHKCFMWYHVRLINHTNIHPERINKQDKKKCCSFKLSSVSVRY